MGGVFLHVSNRNAEHTYPRPGRGAEGREERLVEELMLGLTLGVEQDGGGQTSDGTVRRWSEQWEQCDGGRDGG